MFERRVRIVLLVPILYGIMLVARLYNLQIASGDAYQQKADDALVSGRKLLPPLRGRILDRFGRPLVSDEPANDIAVHYGVLSMNDDFIEQMAVRLKRHEAAWHGRPAAEAEQEIRDRIAKMWVTLEKVSGTPLHKLRARRNGICSRVESLRRYIWKNRKEDGFDESIDKLRLREEAQFHSIIRDISPEVRAQIEVELSGLPFVRVEPSVRRVWTENADPLCHALGTLGQVNAARLESDPLADDDLAAYGPGDQAGVSGIEYLCEDMLRGKRGYIERYLDGRIKGKQAPRDGLDVQLTIDVELQREIHRIIGESVLADENITGGACVVMDVRTREVLALVSFPTFTQTQIRRQYEALRDDTRNRPLLFRAVSEEYQPGSILKPVALLAGYQSGLIDQSLVTHCDGSYIPGATNWHCWTYWKHLPGHGNVNAQEAIQHSCNIFFYTIGERIQAFRLTDFYDTFIRGPRVNGKHQSLTGLLEERDGIIPTVDYLRKRQNRDYRPADGRNYAIGQGEIQITPLQAANMFATLASGEYREPTLIANDGKKRPAQTFSGLNGNAWRTVRNGLFNCVNDAGGTAYKHARLDGLEICGKTGSAQCVARAVMTRYTFDVDGKLRTVDAPTIEKAREILDIGRKTKCVSREILERWPHNREGKTEPPTHAWFAGFAPYGKPEIALAVILEHGGGGGQAAGPLGREIFRLLVNLGYLKATDETIFSSSAP